MRGPVTDELDVLGTDGPEPGRRPSRALLAALCAVALLAAAVLALLQRQDPAAPAPVEVVGQVVLEVANARPVRLPVANRQERDGTASGTIELELPDRVLLGDVTARYSASIEQTGGVEVVLHAWGDVSFDLGRTSCSGAVGWSSFREPLEGGGALQARCDDGAVLAARLLPTPQPGELVTVVDFEGTWSAPEG